MRYLYLLILLVGSSFLFAQPADVQSDSIHVSNVAPADSLNVDQAEQADTTAVKPKRTFNAIVMKAAIDSLIMNNRTEQRFVRLRQQVFMYQSEYHVLALSAQDMYMQDHGFTVRQSPFGIGYELQKRMPFTNCTVDGHSISFEENLYPYPAALATTEYGIGGQDMNYANLSFRKNELVSVDSLYGRFNASFQKGLWGNQNDNSTIEDVFLKYAIRNGNIQLHVNALDWDIAKFHHAWIYPENPNINFIREKSTLISLYWQNKWLNAGYQVSHVNWMTDLWTFSGVHNFNQLLLDKEFQYKALQVQLRYEHFNESKIQSWQDQFVTSVDMRDLGTVALNYQTAKTDLNSKLYLSRPNALGYDNVWQYRVLDKTSLVAKLVGMKSFDDTLDQVHIKNMSLNKATLGVKLSNSYAQTFQVDYGMKTREVRFLNAVTYQPANVDDKTPYVDMTAYVPLSFYKLRTMINFKLEAPYFQSVLDVNSYIDMPYNNRFLFGFSHTYRDKSFLDMGIKEASLYHDYLETRDNLLDAYAGMQITKQFDIRFMVKNIMNQDIILGTSLMPITYQLGVKWDFVN